MGKGNFFFKHLVVLCAFLISGCTEYSDPDDPRTSEEQVDLYNEQLASPPETSNTPLLTLEEMLGVVDVQQALAQAAADDDAEALVLWQEALLSAADQVDLAPNERSLITGKQGLKYLEFQGMKTNYQAAFERVFLEFEDVSKVYENYPAFKNLHERSMALVKQRDELVAKVASQLKEDGYDGDEVAEARRQWQNFFLNESSTN
jgi:hypothetical protein